MSLDMFNKIERSDRARPPRSGVEVITSIPDYYNLLEIDRTATQQEITEAYRYFAKKYHPVNHKYDEPTAREHFLVLFKACNEAYEILGNHKSRAVYDFYGGKAVRNGILHNQFDFREGTGYQKELKEKPESFFRKFNYERGIIPKISSDTKQLRNFLTARNQDLNDPDVESEVSPLHLTLEELYNGGVKTVAKEMQMLDASKPSVSVVEKPIELKIIPGWTHGTKVVYSGSGSEKTCTHPSDLVFEVVVDPHPHFRLKGYNLFVTISIPLEDVIGVGPIYLKHLDGRKLAVSLTELACPNIARLIPGEGLPKDAQRSTYGDLFVNFDIVFPDDIDPWQKLELWVALVEYPPIKPPLHYAIAPISEASLRTAKRISVGVPFKSATNIQHQDATKDPDQPVS